MVKTCYGTRSLLKSKIVNTVFLITMAIILILVEACGSLLLERDYPSYPSTLFITFTLATRYFNFCPIKKRLTAIFFYFNQAQLI